MKGHRICFSESASILGRLGDGFSSIAVNRAAHGRPVEIALMGSDGTGVKITARMNELGDRQEVGSLVFSNASKRVLLPAPVSTDYSDIAHIDKLVIDFMGYEIESGFLLSSRAGHELLIVAGAMPLTIEYRIDGVSQDFQPEFDASCYRRERLL